jgi:hypothetical protein
MLRVSRTESSKPPVTCARRRAESLPPAFQCGHGFPAVARATPAEKENPAAKPCSTTTWTLNARGASRGWKAAATIIPSNQRDRRGQGS